MKFTKTILAAVMLVGVMASAPLAQAQDPRAYTLGNWNGDNGTNAALAPATSGTNTIATSEYNSAKLYVSAKGDGASTANVIIKTFRTGDSSRYETIATTTNLLTLNGTTEVTQVYDLSETFLANVSALRVTIENTNAATRSITNIAAKVRFNAPSVRLKSN